MCGNEIIYIFTALYTQKQCVDIIYKMKKVPKLFILAFTILLFSFPMVTFAQEEDGPDGSGDPAASDVPFDGGVSFLIVAGIGYGIKKMRKDQFTIEYPVKS